MAWCPVAGAGSAVGAEVSSAIAVHQSSALSQAASHCCLWYPGVRLKAATPRASWQRLRLISSSAAPYSYERLPSIHDPLAAPDICPHPLVSCCPPLGSYGVPVHGMAGLGKPWNNSQDRGLPKGVEARDQGTLGPWPGLMRITMLPMFSNSNGHLPISTPWRGRAPGSSFSADCTVLLAMEK